MRVHARIKALPPGGIRNVALKNTCTTAVAFVAVDCLCDVSICASGSGRGRPFG